MPHSPVISKIRVHHPNKKSSRVCNRNYITYIGTREGVDLTDVALEQKLEAGEAPNDIYLQYINERPKSHGLFGNIDVSDIAKLASEVADETAKGKCIYRGILSLCEDDAVSLGYNQKEQWVNLLRRVMPDVGREFNIPIQRPQWCGAVHMEQGHPHCHYVFWDTADKVTSPYIHPSKQNKIREFLSGEIFKEELQQQIIDKTLARDLVLDLDRELLEDELEFITKKEDGKISGRVSNDDMEKLAGKLLKLTDSLPNKGRLAYKLLPPEVKEKVDALVDEVVELPMMKKAYGNYTESVNAISKAYCASERHMQFNEANNARELKKRIANQILKTCGKIRTLSSSIDFSYNPEDEEEPVIREDGDIDFEIDDRAYYSDWSKEYKTAVKELYNSDKGNIDQVITVLNQEAKKGNVLAMHDLGKIYDRGIKTDKNAQLAEKNYQDAFKGFSQLVKIEPEENKPDRREYYNYRLGKMYEAGAGTEQNYEQAICCYEQAGNNVYAKYSLGSMYLRGKGIELTAENEAGYFERAMHLLKESAGGGNAYAAYTFAKKIEERNIMDLSAEDINSYFSMAAGKFMSMLEESENDFLMYRLGTMFYEGKGVEQDVAKAFSYFKRAAALNNSSALYALGKFYADERMECFDIKKAEECFIKAIQEGFEYADHALGMLYIKKDEQLYDLEKGIQHLHKSAEKQNPSSMYQLGKVFSTDEYGCQDMKKAIKYFTQAAELGNGNSMYQLGKVFSTDEYGCQDMKKAIKYFTQAAELGNDNSMYQLAKIYLEKDTEVFDLKRGMKFLEKAIEKNNSYAMAKLGSIYLWGRYSPEIEKDEEHGLKYLKQAVEKGNPYAEEMINFYQNFKNSISVSMSYFMIQGIYRILSTVPESYPYSEAEMKKFARQSKEYKKIQAKENKHGREE